MGTKGGEVDRGYPVVKWDIKMRIIVMTMLSFESRHGIVDIIGNDKNTRYNALL